MPFRRVAARTCVAVSTLVWLAGCTSSPTAPSTWSSDRVREQLLISNLNNRQFGSAGRLTRWRVPVAVNTNGIARAELALQHFEQWTSGAVRFTRVSVAPANGITFIAGGGGGSEATQACGSLGDPNSGGSQSDLAFQWDSSRAITGSYVIHLGSDHCDDETAGSYPSAIAEHLLGHQLGLVDHFEGFQNRVGLDDPRFLAVAYNLYANPLGATGGDLTIWGIR